MFIHTFFKNKNKQFQFKLKTFYFFFSFFPVFDETVDDVGLGQSSFIIFSFSMTLSMMERALALVQFSSLYGPYSSEI